LFLAPMRFCFALVLLVIAGLCNSQPLGDCNLGKARIGSPMNSMIGRPFSQTGFPYPFTCSMSEADIASTGAVRAYGGADRSMRWYVGEVANVTYSNPIVAFFIAGNLVWCRTDFDTTADPSIGYAILYDTPGSLFVTFSSRGFDVGSGNADFRRFSTYGWQPNYGTVRAGSRLFGQGSSKVTVLTSLNPATGDVLAATFLTSKALFGTTGDLVVTGLSHLPANRTNVETIIVNATTAATPLRPNLTRMRCNGAGPYDYQIYLDAGLHTVLATTSSMCA